MKVVVYGATGKAGSRILRELVNRGHTVVAVARHVNTKDLPAGVEGVQDDLSDVNKIAAIIAGADALVSAYAPLSDQLIDYGARNCSGEEGGREHSPGGGRRRCITGGRSWKNCSGLG